MEHLTKQQIILLTLFTTFVTSIATGIVTVSLLDQAPVGVTSTVERVINQTVQEVASDASSTNNSANSSGNSANSSLNTAAAANAVGGAPFDPTASATATGQKSLVKIQLLPEYIGDTPKVTGLGVVVSSAGLIVTDKTALTVQGASYAALFPDGKSFPVAILQSQNNGDIVFLLAQTPPASSTPKGLPAETFIPAAFSDLTGQNAPALGETVVALSGIDTTSVSEGIVRKINRDASSTPISYVTSIDPSETTLGSPLFDLSGDFIGIQTLSLPGNIFYPTAVLKSVVPILSSPK